MFHREGGKLADPFFRYGLDISIENDTEIRATVETVKQYWAKKFQHTRDGQMFRMLHGDKIAPQQLLDPEIRKQIREVIVEVRKKEEQSRFTDLDSAIRLFAADGYLTPAALAELIKEFTAKGCTESDIQGRVKNIPVKMGPEVAPLEEGLSANIRNEIRKNLAVLQKPDLYTLLNISVGAQTEAWKLAIDAASEAAAKMAAGPPKAAMNALLGISATHLQSDPARYEYARLYGIAESLEVQVRRAAGATNIINPVQYTELLRQALELHLPQDTAKKAILWFAHKLGARVQVTDSTQPVHVEICPACRFIIQAQKAPKNCPNCSQALWISCPDCSAQAPVNAPSCLQCRFPLNNRAQIDFFVGAFDRAFKAADISASVEALRQAELIWTGGRVAGCRKRLEQLRQEREAHYRKFCEARSARRLYHARELLTELTRQGNEPFQDGRTCAELTRDQEVVFVQINQLLHEARGNLSRKKYPEAVSAFENARLLAVDCHEAEQGLMQCPPEPPAGIKATVHANSVNLRWQASAASGQIEYVVVRRSDRAPQSLQDGVTVLRSSQLYAEDTQISAGELVYYSVFTERYGAISSPVSSGAILTAFEASSLSITSGEGNVRGSWKPLPSNAKVIVTKRLERAPERVGDGTNVTASATGFEDNHIINEVDHFYHVAVIYHVPQSGNTTTSGLVRKVRPDLPPEPLIGLSLNVTSTEITLSWPPPPHGTVLIYALASAPQTTGQLLMATAELASWPAPAPISGASSASFPRLHHSVRHFVPVTVAEEWAAVGNAIRFLDVPEVSALSASNLMGYLQLQWRWPEKCDLALVSWRFDTYPVSPDDPLSKNQDLTRSQYDSFGGFRLPNPGHQTYYFAVFTGILEASGQIGYGAGLSPGCRAKIFAGRKETLNYGIKKAAPWGKKYKLSLECDTSVRVLPDLALICRRDGIQPTAMDQGVEVLRLTGASPNSMHTFDATALRGYLRLFFVNPELSQGFHLSDPEPRQLKIG